MCLCNVYIMFTIGDTQVFSSTFGSINIGNFDTNYPATLILDCGRDGSIYMFTGAFADMSHVQHFKVWRRFVLNLKFPYGLDSNTLFACYIDFQHQNRRQIKKIVLIDILKFLRTNFREYRCSCECKRQCPTA